mmetsp:Transcript_1302/g.2699  ORF Transcript_1302/g.2699 Transcript_1302/m.2699 type:complete len:285 (+) Transcript_1302:760-1614(+)
MSSEATMSKLGSLLATASNPMFVSAAVSSFVCASVPAYSLDPCTPSMVALVLPSASALMPAAATLSPSSPVYTASKSASGALATPALVSVSPTVSASTPDPCTLLMVVFALPIPFTLTFAAVPPSALPCLFATTSKFISAAPATPGVVSTSATVSAFISAPRTLPMLNLVPPAASALMFSAATLSMRPSVSATASRSTSAAVASAFTCDSASAFTCKSSPCTLSVVICTLLTVSAIPSAATTPSEIALVLATAFKSASAAAEKSAAIATSPTVPARGRASSPFI